MDQFAVLPSTVWAALCLLIAAIYVRVWPRGRASTARGLRYLILRWFHALVWVLLAIAILLRARASQGSQIWAGLTGLLALAVYIAFLVATFTTKQRGASSRDE